MPKISALPPMISADGDDEAPIVDDSTGSTKKFTFTVLRTYLQSLTSWVTTSMLTNANTTSSKLLLDFANNSSTTTYTTPATSVWHNSGFGVTLPTAGDWLVLAALRSDVSSINQFVTFRLFNQTTGNPIANSLAIGGFSTTGGIQTTTPIMRRITTTTPNNVINVHLLPGGAYTSSLITDTSGNSTIIAIRIG